MGLLKISPSFLCALSFIMIHSSLAQDSPQDYLNVHNLARAEVHVGALAWDEGVAAYAQKYANDRINDCRLMHSSGPYGENLAWSSGDMSGADAVKLWVDEKSNYNYDTNSCVGGECLHYTQVVWKDTTRVGCAKVRCNNGGTFIGCNYDPRGNIIGRRPY